MTVKYIYKKGLELLKPVSGDDAQFECDCLFEFCFNIDKIKRIIDADKEIENSKKFFNLIDRRCNGEPLQYIIGSWDFMGYTFSVGEGVLIPRPETEELVEKAVDYIKENNCKTVYDLCAGSGAIGLSVAKMCPNCRVYLFEKFDGALKYLNINKAYFNVPNAHVIQHDILTAYNGDIENADLILSNPPYIKSEEIACLQKEVLKEPLTALDGGEDGLVFYRAIRDIWLSKLNPGSRVLTECGDNQSKDIINEFKMKKCTIKVHNDFKNIDRIVEINV